MIQIFLKKLRKNCNGEVVDKSLTFLENKMDDKAQILIDEKEKDEISNELSEGEIDYIRSSFGSNDIFREQFREPYSIGEMVNAQKLRMENDLLFNEVDKNVVKEKSNKLIAINFKSFDQSINCFIPCYFKDTFLKALEILYLSYPELKEKEAFFLSKGNLIEKFKTLEENKIRNGDVILIMSK